MAAAGEFPKIDGDIFYGEDANKMLCIYAGFEQLLLSATQADADVSYGTSKMYHLLQNTGANIAYINFDAAATTASFQLDPAETIEVYGVSAEIHAICGTGLTTTVRIIGFGDTTQAANLSVGQLSATSVNASLNLATDAVMVLVKNVGNKFAYFNLNGAATTNHFRIGCGVKLYLPKNTMTTLQTITSGGDTTTLCVISAPIL